MTDPNHGTDSTDATHSPAGADYQSDRKFEDFPISDEMLRGILEHGYTTATPVQANTIEPALAGRDLIVRAKTGTGKTAAFSVPVLERLEAGSRVPQGVILAPTRELAQQIAEESDKLAQFKDVHVATLVGGLPIEPQVKLLKKGVELIVGTPGRILDHLRRGNLDLSEAHMLVLDEADEMLSMGFYEDVTKIIKRTREDRQVLLFSATISEETGRLVDEFLRDPEQIQLSTDADNVENIEHILYETDPTVHKIRSLLYVLDIEDPGSAIIFCNTREDTATVASFLDRQGLDVQLLSGELSQKRRSDVMTRVKAGNVRFLVSTDVASRGIDISDLSHVINYALPPDPPVYLHRTGRTGRIGKQGTAISLVGGTDLSTRKSLENKHGLKFDVRHLPNEEDCVQQRVERQARQIREAMSTMVFEAYLPTVRALKERPDGDALLAAALRAFFQWDRSRRAEASGGGVSSVRALLDERSAKMERKGRGRKGSDSRGGPHRGDRRDRNRSDKRPKQRGRVNSGSRPGKKKSSNSHDDLDSFLSLDD